MARKAAAKAEPKNNQPVAKPKIAIKMAPALGKPVAKLAPPKPKPAPEPEVQEEGEELTSSLYRRCRKWTLPRLTPLIEEASGVKLVRETIGSKKTGALSAAELLEYLTKMELETPEWKVRQQNAIPGGKKGRRPKAKPEETAEAAEETVQEEAPAPKKRGRKPAEKPQTTPEQATAILAAASKGTLIKPAVAKPPAGKGIFKLVKKAS
jgi:hypothetical protein